MYQLIFLGLATILAFSPLQKENKTTLTLEIQNFDPDLLQLRDAFGSSPSLDALATHNGKFEFPLSIDKPCIRNFSYGSYLKRIFLCPGQTLQISFDGKNFAGTFKFGGSLAMENVLLDSIKNRISNVDYNYLYAQPIEKAIHYIDSSNHAANQYFEKLVSSIQTNSVFNDYTKASILYNFAYIKIMIIERQKGAKDPNHYAFLDQIKIENENYLEIPYYQWFLDYYISMETSKRYDKLDSIKKRSPKANFDESLQVIGNLKNKKVREFSLTYAIDSRLQLEGLKNFETYYDYFKRNNSNPTYAEFVRKEYEQKQLLAPGKPAPEFTLKDVDGKLISLHDFKGKYVFLDFWQTLCLRSARELPHYLKLHDDYKDENIAFVSISVNEDENVWRNYVKEKKNVGISLRAEKYFASEVYKSYQVPGLPGFVIIDKEGKIIDPFAAKPSSKEIRETLNQLLKSK